MTSDRIVWLDLESTGLKAEQELILEIALLVTEADLTPVDAGYTAVIHCDPWRLRLMTPRVQEMHTQSGLIAESIASTTTLDQAAAGALTYVQQHVGYQAAPCAGSSVRFDRRFLESCIPELEDYLHYRTVDVSSIKELAQRWRPDVYNGLVLQQPVSRHRAMPDILASIAELQRYRAEFFLPAAAVA